MIGGLSIAQRQRRLTHIRAKARKFLIQRSRFIKEIEELIDEIHAELTSAQQVSFKELKMPEVEDSAFSKA